MSQQPPERVRVTGPPRGQRPRPRRSPAREIDAQSELGTLFLRSLIRTQFRLALGVITTLAVVVGGLPLLFAWFPKLGQLQVLGMPLAWVVLGFGCYPLFVVLGLVYVRAAARNERAFTDVLEGP